MTPGVMFLVGFGAGVLAAVLGAALWSWWAVDRADQLLAQPDAIVGDVPFMGHLLERWASLAEFAQGNAGGGSPRPERSGTDD